MRGFYFIFENNSNYIKMKNIKDITLLAFAIVGFYTIITAFTSTESNQPQQVVNGTPESHVWEFHISTNSNSLSSFAINKETGEVRKYNYNSVGKTTSKGQEDLYVVMKAK